MVFYGHVLRQLKTWLFVMDNFHVASWVRRLQQPERRCGRSAPLIRVRQACSLLVCLLEPVWPDCTCVTWVEWAGASGPQTETSVVAAQARPPPASVDSILMVTVQLLLLDACFSLNGVFVTHLNIKWFLLLVVGSDCFLLNSEPQPVH